MKFESKEQILTTVIGFLAAATNEHIYTEEEIDELIENFLRLDPNHKITKEEKHQIKKELHSKQFIKLEVGIVLADNKHQKWFKSTKPTLEMNYWNRYKQYLQFDKNFSTNVINTMDDISDEIVDLMGNPKSDVGFQRRGLVVGDVQSGKTANYIGVINKASDAGYKIIVLLTGTIEKLRKQTQIRVDEGFIGRSSNNSHFVVGVGKYDGQLQPSFFTSIDEDFRATSSKLLGISLNNINDTCILVLKKNVSVLKNLNNWIKNHNLQKDSTIIDNSILVIDDEADNASINTNDSDKEPNAINKQIRILLSLFKNTSYLGFTATPYANVFIDPDKDENKMLADDLFPRDYIYCLDSPTNYIGARDIFGIGGEYSNIVKEITDGDDYYKQDHKIDFCIDSIAPSLEMALNEFYLANVIRDLRGDITSHRSMLVNISRFVNVQNQLGFLVNQHLKSTQDAVRLYSQLTSNEALQNSRILRDLKEVYEKEFSNIEYSWEKIQKNLKRAIEPIEVFVVNGSQNKLNYEENSLYGVRAICVGGLTLSRGLTLEGLVVSYFYRNSKVYDTLMQMGRWFGYRDGYKDICKIWMSEDSINWYSEITAATDELRFDLKKMKENGNTPKDFGIRIKTDSTVLSITARNKMKTAKSIPIIISLSGEFIETPKLYNDFNMNNKNYELVLKFIESLKENYNLKRNENSSKNFGFINIPKQKISEFLSNFNVSPANIKYNSESIVNFIDNYQDVELDNWDIVFLNGSLKGEGDKYKIKFGEGFEINWMDRKYRLKNSNQLIQISGTKNRLGAASDASFGLSVDDLSKLKKDFEAQENISGDRMGEKIYFSHLIKRNPLLMFYFVGLKENREEDMYLSENVRNIPLIGISIGIPTLTNQKTKYIKYMLNLVEQRNFMDYDSYPVEELGENDNE